MPFPAGVVVRNVKLPVLVDGMGNPTIGVLTIVPSFTLKWAATSEIVLSVPVSANIVGGTATIALPIVQSGFVLTTNVRVDAWTYTATVSLPAGTEQLPPVTFILPSGTDDYTLDFDSPSVIPTTVITNIDYNGEPGAPGPANSLTIGTVTDGPAPAATITGTSPNQVLNLVLQRGPAGSPGSAVGMPIGGNIGQIIVKNGTNDYEAVWTDAPTGLPTGGTTGQALVKTSNTDYAVGWATPSAGSGVPNGGTTGQVLTKNSSTNGDAGWQTPASPTVTLANTPSLTRYETGTAGVYPARGTARTDLRIVWIGTVEPPIAASGGATNFVTSGTAMDGVDGFILMP